MLVSDLIPFSSFHQHLHRLSQAGILPGIELLLLLGRQGFFDHTEREIDTIGPGESDSDIRRDVRPWGVRPEAESDM